MCSSASGAEDEERASRPAATSALLPSRGGCLRAAAALYAAGFGVLTLLGGVGTRSPELVLVGVVAVTPGVAMAFARA